MIEYAFYPLKMSGVVFIPDPSLGEVIERTQQVPYVVYNGNGDLNNNPSIHIANNVLQMCIKSN